MSNRYPGGVVRKNQLVPTTSSASGMWTMDQSAQATKSDIWPYSGIANPISQSLRIRRANSAYLQRTPATQTNRSTWTYSFWHKRGLLSASQGLINAGTGAHIDSFTFNSSNKISIDIDNTTRLVSTQVFRDPSAWYHFVWYYDATQATASNRMKVYVNGVEITAFDTDTRSSITSATSITNTTVAHRIGYYDAGILYSDGYMADVNFIDGQALDPSYFGQTSAITGVWEPKQYTGTYGTNGFHLEFKDTTVGKDTSGNNNHWTPNNISTTNDYTYDLSYDVPVSWTPRDGSSVRGNYCVMNPLTSAGGTLSDAGLSWAPGGNNASIWSTFAVNTGKWYFEMTKGSSGDAYIALSQSPKFNNYQGDGEITSVGLYMYYNQGSSSENRFYYNSTSYAFPTGFGNDDSGTVYGVTLDFDTSTITVYRNNNDSTKATFSMPPALTAAPLHIGYSVTTTWPSGQFYWNFGQRPFTYSIPSGFKTLCTTNLPAPTIGATVATAANKYFDATLYTGNGGTQIITNAGGFQPDFIWEKARSDAFSHMLYNSLSGVGKYLRTNLASAEVTDATTLTAFNSNGFTVGAGDNGNNSGSTSVAWQWSAGGSTVTNTTGTISAQVRANQTAGFSIVNYTGDGTNGRTVGHGLGTTPAMIIMKNKLASSDWNVWHKGLGSKGIYLNFTDAAASDNNAWLSFNSTLPGSSVFTIGNYGVTNGGNFISYCWSEIAGYSAFGSYTGNGSADGPFVYTGFRPRWILFKKSSAADDWVIYDTSRNTFNVASNNLFANGNFAEDSNTTNRSADILSNGFKIRSTGTFLNGSGATFIYAAFAEHPFKNSLAR